MPLEHVQVGDLWLYAWIRVQCESETVCTMQGLEFSQRS